MFSWTRSIYVLLALGSFLQLNSICSWSTSFKLIICIWPDQSFRHISTLVSSGCASPQLREPRTTRRKVVHLEYRICPGAFATHTVCQYEYLGVNIYIHIYVNLTLATTRNPILNLWSILHYNTCPVWYWLFMAVSMPNFPLCEGRICIRIRILGLFIDLCIQPPTVETVCPWPSYP